MGDSQKEKYMIKRCNNCGLNSFNNRQTGATTNKLKDFDKFNLMNNLTWLRQIELSTTKKEVSKER